MSNFIKSKNLLIHPAKEAFISVVLRLHSYSWILYLLRIICITICHRHYRKQSPNKVGNILRFERNYDYDIWWWWFSLGNCYHRLTHIFIKLSGLPDRGMLCRYKYKSHTTADRMTAALGGIVYRLYIERWGLVNPNFQPAHQFRILDTSTL